ncbi:MAG: nuclear transport factor 2 family protein [Proteobacteria bacterium]|nr:nuclear transport factor 2 family protein [Pseudomonadota bacterium]
MKQVLFFVLIVFFSINSFAGQPIDREIESSVVKLFLHSDEREWDQLKRVFAGKVVLDYSSFTQQPAAELTPDQIVSAWSGFLPGFKSTHHQLGNFITEISGNKAQVFCYGTATHFLPNESGRNVWTVVGTYDFKLIRTSGGWKVSSMTFNFKYQDGNTDLPTLIK